MRDGGEKAIFVGNRGYVLEKLLETNCYDCTIMAVKGSFLEKQLNKRNKPHISLDNKKALLIQLIESPPDLFVSNGCPFILPISEMIKMEPRLGMTKFVNVHPSYLPDLRGADPVPGAILYGRDSGATCHLMDDNIDMGDIISQIKIPYSEDLDAGLLYQLSFKAEADVFKKAFKKNFNPAHKQPVETDIIYYTRKSRDLIIDFTENAEEIVRKVKAANTRSQGAVFFYNDLKFKIFSADILKNKYLYSLIDSYQNNQIVFVYEKCIIIKKDKFLLRLNDIEGDITKINNRHIFLNYV